MSNKPIEEIPVVEWSGTKANLAVDAFLKRPAIDAECEALAEKVLAEIRKSGDAAVMAFAENFDGIRLSEDNIEVQPDEFKNAEAEVDPDFKRAAKETLKRVTKFAKAGLRKDWTIPTPGKGTLGERYMPFDRVGVYVPGGAAPLASTVLMTVPIARVAGVPDIVVCTPPGKNGNINPFLLHAIQLAGATRVYRVGGIQAIGAMAYGTKSIPRVQKIVGPGGPYVTAAKRLVYGHVSLDMVAGPSEIAVVADDSVSPAWVAVDLLSQAEHGTGHEKALLVTNTRKTAMKVRDELMQQAEELPRTDVIYKVIRNQGILLVVVPDIKTGMVLVNRFAPEHLELLVRGAAKLVKDVRAAGAIFVGRWTPESAGDFAAGPSHVLPTGGTAALFSGLTVDDFRRRSSVISLSKTDLQQMLPTLSAFGRVETLDAHRRSAEMRFE